VTNDITFLVNKLVPWLTLVPNEFVARSKDEW